MTCSLLPQHTTPPVGFAEAAHAAQSRAMQNHTVDTFHDTGTTADWGTDCFVFNTDEPTAPPADFI